MDQVAKTDGGTARPTGYIRQLDAVRTIAVAMVIATHWEPKVTTFGLMAALASKLFFVTSGFLITGILSTRAIRRNYRDSTMGRTQEFLCTPISAYLSPILCDPRAHILFGRSGGSGIPLVARRLPGKCGSRPARRMGGRNLALLVSGCRGAVLIWCGHLDALYAPAAPVAADCLGDCLCPAFPAHPFPGGN